MTARIVRHRHRGKLSIAFFVLVALVLTIVALQVGQGQAMPASPTDETKVPHYFGPYPNWANSPLTLPNATVSITGDGTGATAEAVVGANGAITAINITDPGSGYTAATVAIAGSGAGASANATVTTSGIVTGVNITASGAGYTQPVVTLTGGGFTTPATAIAYGEVDTLVLDAAGSGYTYPTVDFDMPDDPNGVQATGHVTHTTPDASGHVTITGIVLDNPGSGYAHAPNVVVRDGTLFDPINNGATGATAHCTIKVTSVAMDTFGAGYTSAPAVTITDSAGSGAGAAGTATTDIGGVTAIAITAAGSGYLTPGGIKKFTDQLPGLCDPANGGCPTDPAAKFIPVAVPQAKTYNGVAADEYVIAVVQYRTNFSSSMPQGALVRGYVQIDTGGVPGSQHVPLQNELLNGTKVNLTIGGQQAYGVTRPQYLGPTIAATKDKPVRIVFYNLLPTGNNGDLFLPVDTTMMGSGMGNMNEPFDPIPVPNGTVMDTIRNPMCTEAKSMGGMCFLKNRATLHLHGGITPWISDGTAHQWITPAGESTTWPQGVSVENVPDMNVCTADNDGCMTFYYTNQQSARLLFYHDHSWGITRLNVYAGEAAGYLITDQTEQKLIGAGGAMAGLGYGTPLIVQDKTFVPDPAQLAWQDPTWDSGRWGGQGNLWYHHVYMPAQNPSAPGGMSAFGRWMYGPWFWPPANDAKYGPIANPYYDPNCNLDDPATWQYQEEPFCEPQLIPGTPNISAGMEQFNDTPVINGVAYPTLTVEPKTYRFRVLNAANDRFFNFQWYVGDPSTASTSTNSLGLPIGPTEVALNEAEVAAAQTDPVVFPTPDLVGGAGSADPTDPSFSLAGPDWIQIGTEGGFLPAPVVVDGQQITTWITDPTRFDVGNVDQHSLLLAPAERADVIVDFSKFAGKTLILYNDAPAAFPARIPSYDYYTGAPDLRPVGAPTILPGYGPNTRTVMQVKVAASPVATAFNLTALRNAFSHKADGSGVFESGQHPIIVGQAPYNTAYGSSFAASGWCNAKTNPSARCDGYARISEQGGDLFKFDTLNKNTDGSIKQVAVPIEPKAIHDETNASSFDEFGRMQANLGVEAVPATPGMQNVVLHPFTFPPTELIDGTNLPKQNVVYDANGQVVSDVKIAPISSGSDGTQIWKITHNGVDTHPIHFHLYDVQLINRVTWDNIIIKPDATELGWKDTVRMAPLEDTIVALRPVIPKVPWDLPNSIRLISPMMADQAEIISSTKQMNAGQAPTAVAPNGEPIDVFNHYMNFGAEYVYHCHILSHEEMDMMRPVSVALPPLAPSNLTVSAPIIVTGGRQVTLSWKDNSKSETAWLIQRATTTAGPWTDVKMVPTAATLDKNTGRSTGGTITTTDIVPTGTSSFAYQVVAVNTVGDTWDYADPAINQIVSGGFPNVSVKSAPSNTATWANGPAAPSNVVATLQSGTSIRVTWRDNANNETGFVIQRSVNGGAFTTIFTGTSALFGTGLTGSYVDNTVTGGNTYVYQVAAYNAAGPSAFVASNAVTVPAVPLAPTDFRAVNGPNNLTARSVILSWQDNSNNETGFTIQRATNSTFTANLVSVTRPANSTTYTVQGLARGTAYYFRIRANNGTVVFSAWVNASPFPIRTNP